MFVPDFFGLFQAEVIEWFFTTYFSMEALLRTALSVAQKQLTLSNFPGFTFQPHPLTLDAYHKWESFWVLLPEVREGGVCPLTRILPEEVVPQ